MNWVNVDPSVLIYLNDGRFARHTDRKVETITSHRYTHSTQIACEDDEMVGAVTLKCD